MQIKEDQMNDFRNNNRNPGNYRNNDNRQNDRQGFDKPLKNFFTEKGLLKLDWISDTIKELAFYLGNNCNFTTSQLRNFYHEYLRIKSTPASSEEKKIMVKMLKAKVNYKVAKVPKEFIDFTSNLVDEINTDELFSVRFENACILMEALVAYNPKR